MEQIFRSLFMALRELGSQPVSEWCIFVLPDIAASINQNDSKRDVKKMLVVRHMRVCMLEI